MAFLLFMLTAGLVAYRIYNPTSGITIFYIVVAAILLLIAVFANYYTDYHIESHLREKHVTKHLKSLTNKKYRGKDK